MRTAADSEIAEMAAAAPAGPAPTMRISAALDSGEDIALPEPILTEASPVGCEILNKPATYYSGTLILLLCPTASSESRI